MAHTSVKISANSSDYQSQMKSAASQMKVLSSEFKLAQTQAKAFGSAADQLKAKAESLTQKITLQKNIVQLNSEQQAKLTQKLSDQKTKQEELKTKCHSLRIIIRKIVIGFAQIPQCHMTFVEVFVIPPLHHGDSSVLYRLECV